ncbi:MAG TPA: nuclear transport factor 2 family protein [Chitinophagaceae bacterium]|nr:nuclear transport factor 2 family protein [Chitinophagaceae bacterium]
MKRYHLVSLLALSLYFIACSTTKIQQPEGLPAYVPENKALYDTIARMDSLFFDAYNNCKLDVNASLISDDLEFYHDRGGLSTSKSQLVESLKNNICGKVTRELLKGSIEVYPIPGYGAVEMGAHRFYNNQEKERGPSRFSKFVHIWEGKNGKWKLARVISLH